MAEAVRTERLLYETQDKAVCVHRDTVRNVNKVEISGSHVNNYSDGSKVVQTPNGSVFIGKDARGQTLIRTSTQAVTSKFDIHIFKCLSFNKGSTMSFHFIFILHS